MICVSGGDALPATPFSISFQVNLLQHGDVLKEVFLYG